MIALIALLLLAGDPGVDRVTAPYPWPKHVVLPPISKIEEKKDPPAPDPAPKCLPANSPCEFPDGKP